jgi:transposase InsO family protein
MRNFASVKTAVTRHRQARGEAAALAKLGEVYNRVRQRQHARNRGQALGEMLKNMWNLKHGRSIVPPGVNMSKKTKANSPGALQRTTSMNKKLENVRKEHSRLVAEAAAEARRNVSAHSAGTWVRTASGGFKLKKN